MFKPQIDYKHMAEKITKDGYRDYTWGRCYVQPKVLSKALKRFFYDDDQPMKTKPHLELAIGVSLKAGIKNAKGNDAILALFNEAELRLKVWAVEQVFLTSKDPGKWYADKFFKYDEQDEKIEENIKKLEISVISS